MVHWSADFQTHWKSLFSQFIALTEVILQNLTWQFFRISHLLMLLIVNCGLSSSAFQFSHGCLLLEEMLTLSRTGGTENCEKRCSWLEEWSRGKISKPHPAIMMEDSFFFFFLLLTSYQNSFYFIVSWELKQQEVIRPLQDPLSLWENTVQKEMYMQKEFPGGPVVRTLYFHCRRLGSIPDQDPVSHMAKKKKRKKFICRRYR